MHSFDDINLQAIPAGRDLLLMITGEKLISARLPPLMPRARESRFRQPLFRGTRSMF